MSRTKGKLDAERKRQAQNKAKRGAPEAHEHVDAPTHGIAHETRQARSKLPRGAAERRRGSYGYRTSPRSG